MHTDGQGPHKGATQKLQGDMATNCSLTKVSVQHEPVCCIPLGSYMHGPLARFFRVCVLVGVRVRLPLRLPVRTSVRMWERTCLHFTRPVQ